MLEKIIGILGIMFFIILIGTLFWITNVVIPNPLIAFSKQISGKVYDCKTGQPIDNAQVSIQGRGWGLSKGQLVWDGDYIETKPSNHDGSYTIKYKIGTKLIGKKEGYLNAYDYVEPGTNGDIGLLKKSAVTKQYQDEYTKNPETTYRCQLYSDCIKTVPKNGTTFSWDSCVKPDYKP